MIPRLSVIRRCCAAAMVVASIGVPAEAVAQVSPAPDAKAAVTRTRTLIAPHAPTPPSPSGTGGVRIVEKPVVYESPGSRPGGPAQFDVAVRLNKSLGTEGVPRLAVTTLKHTDIAVDDFDASAFARKHRHCYDSRTVYDHIGNRRTKPGDLVRVQLDFVLDETFHRVTRIARVYRATEATNHSDTVFERVAARRLHC
jgi:hypothetical protein